MLSSSSADSSPALQGHVRGEEGGGEGRGQPLPASCSMCMLARWVGGWVGPTHVLPAAARLAFAGRGRRVVLTRAPRRVPCAPAGRGPWQCAAQLQPGCWPCRSGSWPGRSRLPWLHTAHTSRTEPASLSPRMAAALPSTGHCYDYAMPLCRQLHSLSLLLLVCGNLLMLRPTAPASRHACTSCSPLPPPAAGAHQLKPAAMAGMRAALSASQLGTQ